MSFTTISVGRESGNDIIIHDDPFISKNHCQFIMDESGNCYVTDLNSRNGTFVNGMKRDGKVRLNRGDVVRIGNTTLPWQSYFPSYTEKNTYYSEPPRQSYNDQHSSYYGSHSSYSDSHSRYSDHSSYSDHRSHSHHRDYSDSWNDTNKTDSLNVIIFFTGLISFGLIVYIIINFFTNGGAFLMHHKGGTSVAIKLFPAFLKYGEQWVPMIAAVVLGIVTDFLNAVCDYDDNKLSSAGLWLGNAGVSVGTIFILLAIFADQILRAIA